MQLLLHAPQPPLAEYVEYLWAVEDAPSHAHERVLPSGTLELVVNLAEDVVRIDAPSRPRVRRAGALVSGPYDGPFIIETAAHARMVGVHLRPGKAGALLGVPPGAIGPTHVDLADLWGPAAGELRARLCEEATAAGRFALLERALLARLARAHARDRLVSGALAHLERTDVRIGRLAELLGVSHRHLIQTFTAEVGLSPKVFARVRRFRRALDLARQKPELSWGALALECGFYDQSHLNRECSSLGGVPPQALVPVAGPAVKEHHVAVVPSPVKFVQDSGRRRP